MSTILIIEDEDRIASFVAKGLKAAGFTSHRTASGVEGATLAVHGNFDLVILDRVAWGVNAILGKLEVEAPWRVMLLEYLFDGAPATPMGEAELAWRRRRP